MDREKVSAQDFGDGKVITERSSTADTTTDLSSKKFSGFQGIYALRIQSLGVCATAALVNSSGRVLQLIHLPGRYAALTCCHYVCTFVWSRVSMRRCTRMNDVPWPWLLLIACLGSLGVVASNLLLQISTVTFQQLSKLFSLPAGAFIDFVVHKKKRSRRELWGVICVAYGVYYSTTGNALVKMDAVAVAVVYLAGYLAAPSLLNHACRRHSITASEYLYLSAPWGVLCSFFWLVLVTFWGQKSGSGQEAFRAPELAFWFSLNIILAISVQWFSIWTAMNSTTMMYAVVGQVKTAATVLLSVFILDETISFRSALGLSICLVSAFMLTVCEFFENDFENKVASRLVSLASIATILCVGVSLVVR